MNSHPQPPLPLMIPGTRAILILLAIAAAAGSLAFIHFPGTEDVTLFWIRWSELVSQHGLREGYRQAFTDYPPGVFILFFLANAVLAPISQFALVKGMILLAVAAGALIYGAWGRHLGWTVALVFAVLLSSSVLAYIDVLYLAPVFASFWALQRQQVVLASFCFGAAIMLKWQPIIVAPFFISFAAGIALEDAKAWRRWMTALLRILVGAGVPVAICLVLVEPAIMRRAFSLATSHPALSLQALNLNWVIELCLFAKQGGKHVYDVSAGPILPGLMRVIFYLLYGAVFAIFLLRRRSFAEFVWFSGVAFFLYFLVNLGVHENHLFVPMVLAFALPCAGLPRSELPVLFLAVMANTNLLLFYGLEGGMLLKGVNMLVASGIFALVNLGYGILCVRGLLASVLADWRYALAGLRANSAPLGIASPAPSSSS